MEVNSTIDPIFAKYHGAGFSPSLVLLFTPTFIISFICFIFNWSLIFVCIKFRASLFGSFNVLIAFESFGAALFELSFLIRFSIPLSGTNYIRSDPLCFIFQIPFLLGMGIQFVTMPAIGIERLLCILFPIWFKNSAKKFIKYFIPPVILIGTFYGLLSIYFVFMDIYGELKGKDVMCALGDSQGRQFRNFGVNNTCLLLTSVIIYAVIWFTMLKAAIQGKKILNTYNLHIFKCISVIMAIIIFGWLIQLVGPVYASYIVLSREALFVYFARIVDIMIVAGAMNAPVLFIFSSQYRNCFRAIFPSFLRRSNVIHVGNIVQVQSLQTQQ